jgi:hypothetical protein
MKMWTSKTIVEAYFFHYILKIINLKLPKHKSILIESDGSITVELDGILWVFLILIMLTMICIKGDDM